MVQESSGLVRSIDTGVRYSGRISTRGSTTERPSSVVMSSQIFPRVKSRSINGDLAVGELSRSNTFHLANDSNGFFSYRKKQFSSLLIGRVSNSSIAADSCIRASFRVSNLFVIIVSG